MELRCKNSQNNRIILFYNVGMMLLMVLLEFSTIKVQVQESHLNF